MKNLIQVGVNRGALFDIFNDVLDSGHLTEGKYVKMLEEVVSAWTGLHCIAFNSAGSGLFAVMSAYPNGTAIVPNNTFYATGAMTAEAGHGLTLADCSRNDFSVSLEALQAAYDGTQEYVVLTHVGGGLAQDYAAIAQWCSEEGLLLVEDAAHALGVKHNGLHAGKLGDAAVFSLYPTKAIPAGEGGLVVTPYADLAEELREFRNYGKRTEGGVITYGRGFNLRMDEWTAAVAWLQVQRMEEIVALRTADADKLRQVVAPLVDWEAGASNWYKYTAPADFPALRKTGKVYGRTDQLVAALGLDAPALPNSDWVAHNHICLPVGEGMFLGMTVGEVEQYLLGK